MLAENLGAQHTKFFTFILLWHLCRSRKHLKDVLKIYFSHHERGLVKSQFGFFEDLCHKVLMGPSTVAALPSTFCSARPSTLLFLEGLWGRQSAQQPFPRLGGTETQSGVWCLCWGKLQYILRLGDTVVFRWTTTWTASFNSQAYWFVVKLLLTWSSL